MFFNKGKSEKAESGQGAVHEGTVSKTSQNQVMVFDADTESFESAVINGSMQRPIIVQFWAPWCGPCKQLGPILEAAVMSTGGKVALARVNLDENQELGSALRIQSIPMVYAFFQGRPVDGFQGSLPQTQIQGFVDKVVELARQAQPDALDVPEALKAAAQALAEGQTADAQGIYSTILNEDPNNAGAYVGIIRTLIAAEQIQQARQFVDNAPEGIAKSALMNEARTALELVEGTPSGEIGKLEKAVENNAGDHQARYDLAYAQFSKGKKAQAIENLLHIIAENREWNEEAARVQLVKFFEAMGPMDPLTVESRKKLSALLFS